MHICSLLNINKRETVVNTPGAFFEKYFAEARQRPRGHLVPRIQQQPYLNGFLSLLYHFMNSTMPSCRLQWGL